MIPAGEPGEPGEPGPERAPDEGAPRAAADHVDHRDERIVRAERLVAGGHALARHDDGRIVFVPGALPGETVVVGASTRRAGVEWAD
ncbi:MAG: TRAM domain-containing protein, partial [Ilumatobacteraceae bacterium]